MSTNLLGIGAGLCFLAAIILVVYMLATRKKHHKKPKKSKKEKNQIATKIVEEDVEHIFDDTFREELRNRGILHFEKVINENAMFLQQDLRLTTSQVNDYMKQEIKKTLTEEFAKYEQSISDAKQIAIDSINKTQVAIAQQREVLGKQLQQQFEISRSQMIAHFEENMADIVNHYVLMAIGDQIDLNDQLDYILGDLEANKQAIIEDISHGA